MPAYSIISKDGLATRATGYPEYNGVFMGVSTLTFRSIASPAPIAWEVGDYVDFPLVGKRFALYAIPSVTKRAGSGKIGDSFIYNDVVFYAETKDLELTPMQDFVKNDNGIHYSSRQSASTFEDVAGIARRLQECMDALHPGLWSFVVATPSGTPESDITEPKEINIGGSCLDGLSAIAENWKGVVWLHSVASGVNVITIGFPTDICSDTDTYLQGKAGGIKTFRLSVANAEEIVTRVYPFGSERNLPSRYYNGKPILNNDSVDIPNLMIPISEWGQTIPEGGTALPDPAKAYVEDSAAVTRLGLRPKRIYFDGSEGHEDIYPTLQGVTIAEVRSGTPDPNYVPADSWDGSQRVDEVLDAIGADDTGDVSEDGTAYTRITRVAHASDTRTYDPQAAAFDVLVDDIQAAGTAKEIRVECTRKFYLSCTDPRADIYFYEYSYLLYDAEDNLIARVGPPSTFGDENLVITPHTAKVDTPVARVELHLSFTAPSSVAGAKVYLSGSAGTTTLYEKVPVNPNFQMRIPQIGFDINKQAALGSGITVAMKDGACAGREFEAVGCEYESETDTWLLTLKRQEDPSLGILYPNNNGYPVASGDHFVLLDIAMPDMYVSIAESRLLAAAETEVGALASEQIQIEPEMDGLYLYAAEEVILEGMLFYLQDTDLQAAYPGIQEAVLVDNVTITTGGPSGIPTWKVTLRDTKRTTFSSIVTGAVRAIAQSKQALGLTKMSLERQIRQIINETS